MQSFWELEKNSDLTEKNFTPMNKLSLLFVALILTACTIVQAQNKRRTLESNRVYMELGPSLTWLYGDPTLGPEKNNVYFNFGLGLTKPLAGPLYTHTGLYVARKGDRFAGQLFDINGQLIGLADISRKLDYAVVPYLLRLEVGDRLRFYGELGPYAAFLFRAEEGSAVGSSTLSPRDVTGEFRRLDGGAIAGTGIGFSLMDNFFGTVGVRYAMGFINTNASQAAGAVPIKTAAFDARFGFGVWLN